MVHLALLLSRLVDVAAVDEERLQLGDHARRDEDVVEQGEEHQLLLLHRVADLPE